MEEPSQFSMGQTAQSLPCSIMEKPHTGLDECPRILLASFRARNSAETTGECLKNAPHSGGEEGARQEEDRAGQDGVRQVRRREGGAPHSEGPLLPPRRLQGGPTGFYSGNCFTG